MIILIRLFRPSFLLFLMLFPSWVQANRFRQYSEQYADPKHAATPIASSYFGGKHNEYLIAGDFLPDGRLYLAGNAYGPEFELESVQVEVLGTDQPGDDFTMKMRKGSPNPPPSWSHHTGAGFIAVLSKDYTRVLRAVRLPWISGVITDLVTDARGGVYVAGLVGVNFPSIGPSTQPEFDDLLGSRESFVGKMKPDLSGFEWLIRLQDEMERTPQLRILDDGTVSMVSANGFHITPQGEVVKAQAIETLSGWQRGACFKTFAVAKGDFSRTRTGYEPWHQPSLQITNPDGSMRFKFYRWDSRTVGMNWNRLVSDSALRVAVFDRRGNPVLGGWSDGGNSVWTKVPYDLTRWTSKAIEQDSGVKTGLPFSTWGAGVGSFLHLNRLDYETGNPLSYTLFASYLLSSNKPNSVRADNLDFSKDNDLLISGQSAWGLIQTRDHVVNSLGYDGEDYMGGQFIAIFTEFWNDIRYSSALPGAGLVELQRHSNNRAGNIRFGSAHVNGRTRVVAVTGAKPHDKFTQVRPVQQGFGGGGIDGMFVVLEMETLPMSPLPTFSHPTLARRGNSVPENKSDIEGLFTIKPGMSRDYIFISLRDTSGKKWPAYYRGQPLGEGVIDAQGKGFFTLNGPSDGVQLDDEKTDGFMRRLGGFVPRGESYPPIQIQISLEDESKAAGVIDYNGKRLENKGPYSIRKSNPVGRGIQISGEFRATKKELGLAESSTEMSDTIIIEWWAPGRPAPDGAQVTESSSSSSGAGRSTPQELRTWTNNEGQKVVAQFVAVHLQGVQMKLKNGQSATVPLPTLSDPDQKYVHEQTGFRIWTNQEGESVIARKLGSSDGIVYISTPNGQRFNLPIELLSTQDQQYVK